MTFMLVYEMNAMLSFSLMQRNISDNQLLLLSFALVLPVVIVLTAWLAVDPLTSQDTVIAVSHCIIIASVCCL